MSECKKCNIDGVLEQWARMVKVADKFTLGSLEDTGDDWRDFCSTMNALVCTRKIQA